MAIGRTPTPTHGPQVLDPVGDRHAGVEGLLRIARAMQTALAGDQLDITDLKRNPGHLIAELEARGPMLLGSGRRPDAPEAVLMSAEDARHLADGVTDLLNPRLLTGRELVRCFGHDGAPSALALNPPPERPHVTSTLSDVLSGSKSWKTDGVLHVEAEGPVKRSRGPHGRDV